MKCSKCKHWGGQGVTGVAKTLEGDDRVCMAHLFGDYDNNNFKPMPYYNITFGNINGAKGQLYTNKDFGCINYNPEYDKID